MNTAILTYRFRQLWKIIREIPPLYLLLLALMAAAFVAGLYTYAAKDEGAWVITVLVLFLLVLLHTRRKDYPFIFHIEEKPRRIFAAEYLLLALPVWVIEWIQGQWAASLLLIAGCVVIAFIPQPRQAASKGMAVPSFIPASLFEVRSGFRRYGVIMLVMYLVALGGLFVPFLSLAFLFFYTCSYAEFYRVSEPASILCAHELPVGAFLHRKLWTNSAAYFLSMLPVCMLYAILYPAQAWFAACFLLYGTLNIALMVVTKYAYYRPQAHIVAGQFPLLLSLIGMVALFLLPLTLFFLIKNYLAACRNLTTWLYAYDTRLTSTV